MLAIRFIVVDQLLITKCDLLQGNSLLGQTARIVVIKTDKKAVTDVIKHPSQLMATAPEDIHSDTSASCRYRLCAD